MYYTRRYKDALTGSNLMLTIDILLGYGEEGTNF